MTNMSPIRAAVPLGRPDRHAEVTIQTCALHATRNATAAILIGSTLRPRSRLAVDASSMRVGIPLDARW